MPSVPLLLDRARDEWPPDLVPPEAFALVSTSLESGPAVASGLYAECHLDDEVRTDLVVRLHPHDRDALLRDHSCSPALSELLEAWRRPHSPLGLAPALDLEFDLPGRVEPWFPCPLFEPEFLGGIAGVVRRDERLRGEGLPPLAEANGAAMLQLLSPGVSSAALEHVERCRRAMPAWGVFMPGWVRPTGAAGAQGGVRVLVSMPRHRLVDYLKALRWEGDLRQLEGALVDFAGTEVELTADLTIGEEGLLPKVGLYWERMKLTPRDASVERVCQRVRRARWVRRGRRWEALLRWIKARGTGATRSLSLKLVLSRGRPPALKAYVPNFDAHSALAQSVGKG